MNDWKENNGSLEKLFVFENFKEVLSFVNQVGAIAEEIQHHPDIKMQNYKEVYISTTTHDQGNVITEKDHKLVELINNFIN